MNAADSRRRADYVLAGIQLGDLAEDGSWPDPALPPLADGMAASEAREQVNGYLTAALGITRQPASS
jgi:hypothetical protein